MSGTRNKQTYSNFCVDRNQMLQQSTWLMDPIHNTPAFPAGLNNPAMPPSVLSKHFVDIESSLYGIGSNNFISPPSTPDFTTNTLPCIPFYNMVPLMIPKLDYVQDQRPIMK